MMLSSDKSHGVLISLGSPTLLTCTNGTSLWVEAYYPVVSSFGSSSVSFNWLFIWINWLFPYNNLQFSSSSALFLEISCNSRLASSNTISTDFSTVIVLLLYTLYAWLWDEQPRKIPSPAFASNFPRLSFPLFKIKHLQPKLWNDLYLVLYLCKVYKESFQNKSN